MVFKDVFVVVLGILIAVHCSRAAPSFEKNVEAFEDTNELDWAKRLLRENVLRNWLKKYENEGGIWKKYASRACKKNYRRCNGMDCCPIS